MPVMVARGWTEPQKRAYVIADNQLASISSWDRETLAYHMQLLDDSELARAIGFSDADLKSLCDADAVMGDERQNADVGGSRFMLLLEFDDEPTLQSHFDELRGRGLRVKVMQ